MAADSTHHDRAFFQRSLAYLHEGLRDGLSHFSGPSRAALLYARTPSSPLRVFDPQGLLEGHQPLLASYYLPRSEGREHDFAVEPAWRVNTPDTRNWRSFELADAPAAQLTGLISYGAVAKGVFYQAWFTEHHPDLCSTGPTQRWLEYAAGLLAQDVMAGSESRLTTSSHVLREYATHAVRDYMVDMRNEIFGWDTRIRVYPVLDTVLSLSLALEEGRSAKGELVFVEPTDLPAVPFLARFPASQRPLLENIKHVRKLLQAVERPGLKLVSDGVAIVGVASGVLPQATVTAEFREGHGFIHLGGEKVASFAGGSFQSTNRQAKLVQVEELLLESVLSPEDQDRLFKAVTALVHHAQAKKHGCTLLLDLTECPLGVTGQHLERPIDLAEPENLKLARALARVDGALHIGGDGMLYGFACLLDGLSVPGENLARGARFNSAIRFTAQHPGIAVVVVSADRPVSVLQNGVELTGACAWSPLSTMGGAPPTLDEWVG